MLRGTPGSLHAGKGHTHEGRLTRDLANQNSCNGLPPERLVRGFVPTFPSGDRRLACRKQKGSGGRVWALFPSTVLWGASPCQKGPLRPS